jgi:prevent-host-death family protein
MKFVNVRDLRINASSILEVVKQGEDVVVTYRGKPEAAVIRLTEDMVEDFVVARNRKLLKSLRDYYLEYKKKGGISHEEMRKLIAKKRRG